jgi:hypothetical protein
MVLMRVQYRGEFLSDGDVGKRDPSCASSVCGRRKIQKSGGGICQDRVCFVSGAGMALVAGATRVSGRKTGAMGHVLITTIPDHETATYTI